MTIMFYITGKTPNQRLNMQAAPTCKVVKRPGQRGARIYPRGCRVRREIGRDNVETKYNKEGLTKTKISWNSRPHGGQVRSIEVRVFPDSGDGPGAVFLVDTGAMNTAVSREATRVLGLDARGHGMGNGPEGSREWERSVRWIPTGDGYRGVRPDGVYLVSGIDDRPHIVPAWTNIPLRIRYGGVEERVRTEVTLTPGQTNLLGVNTMRELRRFKFKLKAPLHRPTRQLPAGQNAVALEHRVG